MQNIEFYLLRIVITLISNHDIDIWSELYVISLNSNNKLQPNLHLKNSKQ